MKNAVPRLLGSTSSFPSNDERYVTPASAARHALRWVRKRVRGGASASEADNLFRTSWEAISQIDQQLEPVEDRGEAIRRLRTVGLNDFGCVLWSLPHRDLPNLSRLLPRMASEVVQRSFTGASGRFLLAQSIDFIRVAANGYSAHQGAPLNQDTQVLDFGCGYGRLARLMYHHVDEERFHGVDPWDEAIKICHDDGLNTHFSVSDYLPEHLPVGDTRFDLIYAFSVFTHLSPRATVVCLEAMTRYLAADGLILITLRPKAFWDNARARRDFGLEAVTEYKAQHQREGIAFAPHNRAPVDGDITYGDTTMTLEWLESHVPSLRVVGTDASLSDQLQRYVFLKRSR